MKQQLKNDLKAYFTDGSLFQNEFYLKCAGMNTYDNGIQEEFEEMFKRGNGGELVSKNGVPAKAAAIHSSSMLAYNFFSWINANNPFTYEDVDYDKVVFEEKLCVLTKGTTDSIHFRQSNAKANMDVVLAGKDRQTGRTSLLFIESKFTEHLSNAKADLIKMPLSYSTPECYFDFEEGNKWVKLVDYWKEKANESKKGYYNGIKQDICHLISLSALKNGRTLEWFNEGSWLKTKKGLSLEGDEEIKFRNIIFSPAECYSEDFNYAQNYMELYREFEKCVKEIIPADLDIGCITYADLWRDMERDIKDSERKKYLERRYIAFQQR